jgi:hypothetical protein
MNTCYYAPSCPHSQSFLEAISRTPYAREFRFVDVTKLPRNQIPEFLKGVPTLVIPGEPAPRTDNAVTNYIRDRQMREREFQPYQHSPGAARPMQGGSPMQGQEQFPNAPADFNPLEMSGFGGEGYSLLTDDTDNLGKGKVVRMTGNMASLQDVTSMYVPDHRMGMGMDGVNGNPMFQQNGGGSGGGSKVSQKQQAMEDRLSALKSARDSDQFVPAGPRFVEGTPQNFGRGGGGGYGGPRPF